MVASRVAPGAVAPKVKVAVFDEVAVADGVAPT